MTARLPAFLPLTHIAHFKMKIPTLSSHKRLTVPQGPAAPSLSSRLRFLIKPPGDLRRAAPVLSKSHRHFHSATSKDRKSYQSNEPEGRLLTPRKVCTLRHFHSNERKQLNCWVMLLTSASAKCLGVWGKLQCGLKPCLLAPTMPRRTSANGAEDKTGPRG